MGAVIKVISDLGKGTQKAVGEVFEEVIEKPGKKIIQETRETLTGTSKEDYRAPEQPEVTPEITPEVVEDEKPTITTRYATRGKRAGQAGTIMEGYGVVTRPKGKSAVT